MNRTIPVAVAAFLLAVSAFAQSITPEYETWDLATLQGKYADLLTENARQKIEIAQLRKQVAEKAAAVPAAKVNTEKPIPGKLTKKALQAIVAERMDKMDDGLIGKVFESEFRVTGTVGSPTTTKFSGRCLDDVRKGLTSGKHPVDVYGDTLGEIVRDACVVTGTISKLTVTGSGIAIELKDAKFVKLH